MSAPKLTVLAVDLGAESGRVMAVHFDGRGLQVEEVTRFANPPVEAGGRLYWDILRLWAEVRAGIKKGQHYRPASLGVDAWGVDFGLLDADGRLIGNPVHYRDGRTAGMLDRIFARVPRQELFAETGVQMMPINTLIQLVSMLESGSPQLEIARTLLTIPDLFNYWLTGEAACEFTVATTTQMLNPRTAAWAIGMLERLGLPTHILPRVVRPGTRLGTYEGLPVLLPACHDTGSAVAAAPLETVGAAYLSSGTWSLVGLEVAEPVITRAALQANVTNEGGVYGTLRLLKNVMGLWIVQQCRRTWSAGGATYSYAALEALARAADSPGVWIDPDDPRFLPPGDHPARVRAFCRQSGQPAPADQGALLRCVLESLAFKYRLVLEALGDLTGRPLEVLHILGGGGRNRLLNQLTADAVGVPVVAGPVEATVLGNALVQLIALGELKDLAQGRQLVREMADLERFEPQAGGTPPEAYLRFEELLTSGQAP